MSPENTQPDPSPKPSPKPQQQQQQQGEGEAVDGAEVWAVIDELWNDWKYE
jgi:hypothetical protein